MSLVYGKWGRTDEVFPGGSAGAPLLSCPSNGYCVALDDGKHGEAEAAVFKDGKWHRPSQLPGAALWVSRASLSCPAEGSCLTTDGSDAVTYLRAGHWESSSPIRGVRGQLRWLSCSKPSFCIALDTYGDAFMYSRGAWSAPTSLGLVAPDVSCTGAESCLAVDGLGQSAYFDGRGWERLARVEPGVPLWSVSCALPSSCVAVGGANLAFDWRA